MSTNKTNYTSTILLLLLGVLAIYAGTLWLVVLIPAAIALWYAPLGRSRNQTDKNRMKPSRTS